MTQIAPDARVRFNLPCFCSKQAPIREMTMPTGTVKFFNTDKGYGFIAPEDGSKDAFVHISAVQAAGIEAPKEGDKLSYELETGQNGKQSATNLTAA